MTENCAVLHGLQFQTVFLPPSFNYSLFYVKNITNLQQTNSPNIQPGGGGDCLYGHIKKGSRSYLSSLNKLNSNSVGTNWMHNASAHSKVKLDKHACPLSIVEIWGVLVWIHSQCNEHRSACCYIPICEVYERCMTSPQASHNAAPRLFLLQIYRPLL